MVGCSLVLSQVVCSKLCITRRNGSSSCGRVMQFASCKTHTLFCTRLFQNAPPMLPKLKLIHPLHLETTCCPCCRGFERLRCACPVLLTRRERPPLKLACWWRIRYSSGPLLLQIHIERQRLFAVPGCNASVDILAHSRLGCPFLKAPALAGPPSRASRTRSPGGRRGGLQIGPWVGPMGPMGAPPERGPRAQKLPLLRGSGYLLLF